MLAKRAVRAGRALERMGWKARATGVVRAKAARPKDRARPLEKEKISFEIEDEKPRLE